MKEEERMEEAKEEERKKKTKYKVRNWGEYNKALKKRGRLTIWIEEEELKKWKEKEKTGKKGRPEEYRDELIKCMGIVRQVYHLALRQTEGFMEGSTGVKEDCWNKWQGEDVKVLTLVL